MTSGSRLIRAGQLRDVLLNVRQGRRALAAKDIAKAVHFYGAAVAGLHFACGIWHETTVAATATLRKVVTGLGLEIEDALAPAPRVEAWELVEEIADGIRVLRTRDAVDLTDDQATERARNIACRLTSRWEFVPIARPSEGLSTTSTKRRSWRQLT